MKKSGCCHSEGNRRNMNFDEGLNQHELENPEQVRPFSVRSIIKMKLTRLMSCNASCPANGSFLQIRTPGLRDTRIHRRWGGHTMSAPSVSYKSKCSKCSYGSKKPAKRF